MTAYKVGEWVEFVGDDSTRVRGKIVAIEAEHSDDGNDITVLTLHQWPTNEYGSLWNAMADE